MPITTIPRSGDEPRRLPDWCRRLSLSRLRCIYKARRLVREERGAVTAEYALIIMAAVGFAGLLILIMQSGEVQAILMNLVQKALNSGG